MRKRILLLLLCPLLLTLLLGCRDDSTEFITVQHASVATAEYTSPSESEAEALPDSPSRSTSLPPPESTAPSDVPIASDAEYVLNTSSKKFHNPACSSVQDIKATNRRDFTGTRDALLSDGYMPCKRCNP